MKTQRGNEAVSIGDVRDECVAVRLRLITRAVTKLYNKALRPYDMTISQMNILVAISSLGEARQQQISRALHLEKSTLSRDVERMAERRWLAVAGGDDGRSLPLRLTAEGTRLLKKALPAWHEAQKQTIKLIGEPGIEALARVARGFGMPGGAR
jgi:DNA-binding MarR family transcriptional regulator